MLDFKKTVHDQSQFFCLGNVFAFSLNNRPTSRIVRRRRGGPGKSECSHMSNGRKSIMLVANLCQFQIFENANSILVLKSIVDFFYGVRTKEV